jgi:hypothetical protein
MCVQLASCLFLHVCSVSVLFASACVWLSVQLASCLFLHVCSVSVLFVSACVSQRVAVSSVSVLLVSRNFQRVALSIVSDSSVYIDNIVGFCV